MRRTAEIRALLERGYKPGTKRKWADGTYQKQHDGTWARLSDGEHMFAGPQQPDKFVNYGKGWVKADAPPPPPEPPVSAAGKLPPDETTLALATAKVAPTTRKMGLFTPKTGKVLADAISEFRDDGKEKGKLSASKYLHKQLAAEQVAPEAQKAIRSSVRTLLADFGLFSRDDAQNKKQKNNVIVVRMKKGVAAQHYQQSGLVSIMARGMDDAQKFFAKNGKKVTPDEVCGADALIHEEIHGCSPIPPEGSGFYMAGTGSRTFLEECSTELSARKVLRDGFGLPDELSDDRTHGAYNEQIETLRQMTMSALFRNGIDTPTDRAWWENFLGETSLCFRNTKTDFSSVDDAYTGFAKALPVTEEQVSAAAKLQGKTAEDIRTGIKDAFKEAVKNTNAYAQQARRNYVSPSSVREAKEMLAAGKKKNPSQYEGVIIWRRRDGGLLIASKPDLGAVPLKEWMEKRGLKYESFIPANVPIYDPDDVGPEAIYDLARNDAMGAVAIAKKLSAAGLLLPEHISMLLQLQDEPAVLEMALDGIHTGPVVRV